MDPLFMIAYGALGLFVGFAAGLLGIGGGGIMVPVFSMLFAMQGFTSEGIMHLSLGTSMATIIFTSFASMRAHYKKRNIQTDMAMRIAMGVLAGTFAATFLASYLQGVYLALFFAAFMIWVAVTMFRKNDYPHNPAPHGLLGNIASGGVIGAISALVSIGGGSLSVPYLMHQNLGIARAIGTSAAIGFPIAISGTLGYLLNGWSHTDMAHYVLGYVYLPAVVVVALTSALTAPLGVKYATTLPVGTLKKIFGILAVALSIKMVWGMMASY